MSPFEYASGLVSIVVGLGVARVLGGFGTFISARQRSASDWIVALWCIAILGNLIGWWIAVWNIMREQVEISLATLFVGILATSLLYLAAYVLIPGAPIDGAREGGANLHSPRAAFYYCLGAHFGVVALVIFFFETVVGTGFTLPFVMVGTLAAVSAAGAAAKGNRSRALHLATWTTLLVVMMARTVPRIG